MLACTLFFTTETLAETIGIRFIVSEDLGRSIEQQKTTETMLKKYVMELNGYYRNSEVSLNAEIVQIVFSRIEAVEDLQILDDMAHERNGFTDMFQKANEFGADYTVAIAHKLLTQGNPGCGRGYAVNKTVAEISSTRRAFAVVNFVCGAHTLAHELGHLMGLNHGTLVDLCNPNQGHTTAIAPYANGYGEGNCDGKPQTGEFGDIMVGGHMREIMGNDKASLPMYSNPRIHDDRCGKNRTCGDPVIGDAARALNENAHSYASHEEPDVQTLNYGSAEFLECIVKKYKGRKISSLVELACPNSGIRNIAGIEKLTALRRIDLSGNRIEDVSALENLPHDNIEKIDLTGNPQVSCLSLSHLLTSYHEKLARPDSCRYEPPDSHH